MITGSVFTLSAAVLPTVTLGLAAYIINRFTTRVSPGIPYVGEGSWSERLRVPVEYGKDPVGTLVKAHKKLGSVFCVDLIVTRIVFVLGAERNREFLRSAEEDLSFWDYTRWVFGPKLSAAIDYPGWFKCSMKMLKTGVLKQERIENYRKMAVPVAGEYFERWSKEDSIPLFHSFSHLMLATALALFLGDDFRRKHGDEVIPMMVQYETDLQDPILRVLPFRLWGWCTAGGRIYKAQSRFDELMTNEMKERLANPEKYAERSDYFNAVIEELGDKFQACYGQHLIGIIFAAHANMGMTIPWMFLHARRTPGALERWKSEILDGKGSLKSLTLEQAGAHRPFLDASMRETGRLYTNTLILRMTTKPVQLAGHTLPPKTAVACSPLASQRDESVFSDAADWNPDRFLQDGAYASWFKRGEFVQFGMGTHVCPGEKLARMVVFDAVIGTWMKKYDLEVVGGLKEGEVGIGGVGVEAAWIENNLGTPSVRGEDVRVSVKLRET